MGGIWVHTLFVSVTLASRASLQHSLLQVGKNGPRMDAFIKMNLLYFFINSPSLFDSTSAWAPRSKQVLFLWMVWMFDLLEGMEERMVLGPLRMKMKSASAWRPWLRKNRAF